MFASITSNYHPSHLIDLLCCRAGEGLVETTIIRNNQSFSQRGKLSGLTMGFTHPGGIRGSVLQGVYAASLSQNAQTAICLFWLRIFLPSKIFEKSPGYQLGEAYLTQEEQKHLPPSLGYSLVFSCGPSCSPWFPGLTVPTHMLREPPKFTQSFLQEQQNFDNNGQLWGQLEGETCHMYY